MVLYTVKKVEFNGIKIFTKKSCMKGPQHGTQTCYFLQCVGGYLNGKQLLSILNTN